MPNYNLIEYSDHYSKKFGILWPYCRGELDVDATNGNIVDFTVPNSITDLFKTEEKITSQRGNNVKKYIKIMMLLKYLSNI